MEEWVGDVHKLEPNERAECYRAYAHQMLAHAKEAASDEIRAGFVRIAEDWFTLADSTEAVARAATDIASPVGRRSPADLGEAPTRQANKRTNSG